MAFIRRVTVVGEDGHAQKLYGKKKKKKRKVSKWLRPAERRNRKLLKAQKAWSDELLHRHNRSSRKRRNGFMRDGSLNVSRANRKAMKKLMKGRMF